jgi:hypothetical protein
VRSEAAQARVAGRGRSLPAPDGRARRPWAVLSAGVDHETFKRTLEEAIAGGASGFIAGRSLWKEAALLERDERRAFLEGEGRRRLAELLALLPSADRSPARLLCQTRALADQEESASNLFERDR